MKLQDRSWLLQHNKPVADNKGIIKIARFIVMEEPFGRERAKMNELIDFVACITLPLEVALARRLLRDVEWCLNERSSDYLAAYIKKYLTGYLSDTTREMYLEVNARVLKNCDLVLNSVISSDELANEMVVAIKTRPGAA